MTTVAAAVGLEFGSALEPGNTGLRSTRTAWRESRLPLPSGRIARPDLPAPTKMPRRSSPAW